MVVAVAGTWELGYSAPLTERDVWLYPLRDYAVDRWYMAPISGIRDQMLTEVRSLESLIHDTRLTKVFVDEKGETPLEEFEHPRDDVLYILGRTGFSPWAAYGMVGHKSVRIRTPVEGGMLWPHQAIAIVLHDRWVKSWR